MAKKRILIVDDEVGFAELTKENLEATGKYEAVIESKGSNAFDLAREYHPDLILLDIIMPDMGGDEVCEQLRKSADTKHIPVLLLTAIITEEEERKHEGVASGYPVLAKPVSIEKLLDTVQKMIDNPPNVIDELLA